MYEWQRKLLTSITGMMKTQPAGTELKFKHVRGSKMWILAYGDGVVYRYSAGEWELLGKKC